MYRPDRRGFRRAGSDITAVDESQHLAPFYRLSLSNTVRQFEISDGGRSRSTVQNWILNADQQPKFGRHPDYVAVDESVTRLNDERYWQYVAVGPGSNEFSHTELESAKIVVSRAYSIESFEWNTASSMSWFPPTVASRCNILIITVDSSFGSNDTVIGPAPNLSAVM